jgi:hypothetical protein
MVSGQVFIPQEYKTQALLPRANARNMPLHTSSNTSFQAASVEKKSTCGKKRRQRADSEHHLTKHEIWFFKCEGFIWFLIWF